MVEMVDHTETASIAQREARQDRPRKAPRKRAEARAHERSKTPYWRKRLVQWALPWRGDTDDEDSEDDIKALQDQEFVDNEHGDQDDQMEEAPSQPNLVIEKIQEDQVDSTDELSEMDEMEFNAQPQPSSPLPPTHSGGLEPPTNSDKEGAEDRQQSLELRGSRRKTGSRSSTPVQSTRRTTRSQAAKVEGSPAPEGSLLEEQHESITDVADVTEDLIQESEESTSKVGRKKKKKKNNKKRSKGVTYDEVEEPDREEPNREEPEREAADEELSLPEKIQNSEELIAASERMLQHLNQPSSDPFSESLEDTVREQDDETFHSTSQFELTESTDENRDDPESADITIDYDEVKYYPPDESKNAEASSVDGNMELEISTEDGEEAVIAEQVEEITRTDVSETEDILDVSEDDEDLNDGGDISIDIPDHKMAEMIEEHSKLKDIQPTPETPAKEHFEDCPPIVTPATHKIKDFFVSESNELPESSTAFLAMFFAKQAGKMLTPMQADYCKKLIDDAVIAPKIESTSATWHSGEDGVSFREQSQSHQPLTQPKVETTALSPVSSNTVSSRKANSGTLREAANTTSILRAVKPIAPFKVIRQGVSDLYHDASAREPKQEIMPSLDDYLEINKYEGVAWDDLPGHVKVKRFLEWKGPEAPEVVRKRTLEERRKIREAFEEANKIVPDSLKRGADNVDPLELPTKKALKEMPTSQSPVVALVSSLDSSAQELTSSLESAPKLSAVAQEVLSIVNNTKAVQNHATAETESSAFTVSTPDFLPSSASIPETSSTAPFSIATTTPSILGASGHKQAFLSESESGKPGIFAIPAPTTASASIFSIPSDSFPATTATEAAAIKPAALSPLTPFSAPTNMQPDFGAFTLLKADSSKLSSLPSGTTTSSPFSSALHKASTIAEASKPSIGGNPFSFGTPDSTSITSTTNKPVFSFGGSNPFASVSNSEAPVTSSVTSTLFSSAEASSGFSFGGPVVTETSKRTGTSASIAAPLAMTATATIFGSTFSGFGGSSNKSSDNQRPKIIEIDYDDSADEGSISEGHEDGTSNSQSPTQAGDVSIALEDGGDDDDDESFNLGDDDEDDENDEDEEHSGEINLNESADENEYGSQEDQSIDRVESDQDGNELATASGKSSFGHSRFTFEFDTPMTGDDSDDEDQNANSHFGDEEDEVMEQEWEGEVSEEEDGTTISPLASPVMTRRTL